MSKFEWSAAAKAHYAQIWAVMRTQPSRKAEVQAIAKRIAARRDHYAGASAQTGVPWWFIGVLHEREAVRPEDFTDYLGNGQPYNVRTTQEPIGHGPFGSWTSGAVYALKYQGFDKITDWSIEHALFLTEKYNGPGYWNKGLPSPYVVGGSNVQVKGKWVRDHEFDPNVMDEQIGTAVMLKELLILIPTLFGSLAQQPAAKASPTTGVTVSTVSTSTSLVQVFLGAVLAAFGAQGADLSHLAEVAGGLLVVGAAVVSHLHLVSASNANTLENFGAMLSHIGTLSAQNGSDGTTPPSAPAAS